MNREFKHGDLAYVVMADHLYEEPVLARYWVLEDALEDDDPNFDHWEFFGTDITARPDEVRVVCRVKVVTEA